MKKHLCFAIVLCSFINAHLVFSQERSKSSDFWRLLSPKERTAFVAGFAAGMEVCTLQEAFYAAKFKVNLKGLVPEKTLEEMGKQAKGEDYMRQLRHDPDAISDVVSSLYKDPANCYIDFTRMIFVADDKLKGEDVGKKLRDERKAADWNYENIDKKETKRK